MEYTFMVPSAELEMKINPETEIQDIQDIQKAVGDKVKQLQAELKASGDKLESLEIALGEHKTPDAAKSLVEIAQKFRESLVTDAMKWGKLSGLITEINQEAKQAFLNKSDIETIKMMGEDWRKIHDEKNPGTAITKPDEEDKNQNKERKPLGLPDDSVRI